MEAAANTWPIMEAAERSTWQKVRMGVVEDFSEVREVVMEHMVSVVVGALCILSIINLATTIRVLTIRGTTMVVITIRGTTTAVATIPVITAMVVRTRPISTRRVAIG